MTARTGDHQDLVEFSGHCRSDYKRAVRTYSTVALRRDFPFLSRKATLFSVLVFHVLVPPRDLGGNDFTAIPANTFDAFSALKIL